MQHFVSSVNSKTGGFRKRGGKGKSEYDAKKKKASVKGEKVTY